MITLKDLNPKGFPETYDQTINMTKLCSRVNRFLERINYEGRVTSGLRSIEDHKRIYADLAKKRGLKTIRVPMGSKHLSGEAVDIHDPQGILMKKCRENVDLLEEIGLWVEDDTSVARVHLQCTAPQSGNRFFKP